MASVDCEQFCGLGHFPVVRSVCRRYHNGMVSRQCDDVHVSALVVSLSQENVENRFCYLEISHLRKGSVAT